MRQSDEMSGPRYGSWSYRTGVAGAVGAALLTVWSTLVRDDGNGLGSLMLVMAAAVGSFTAGLRPARMARAMLGIAIMQALLGVAIATAPPTASVPDGSFNALLFSGFFAAMWLISAALFRSASRSSHDEVQRTRA